MKNTVDQKRAVPGSGGNRYVPFDKRTGDSSVVFFTRDLSEQGLKKIYDRVSSVLTGKVAVKLHTGEAEGPNIIPRPWVNELLSSRLPDATIIETNTYYEGSRYTTDAHRRTHTLFQDYLVQRLISFLCLLIFYIYIILNKSMHL